MAREDSNVRPENEQPLINVAIKLGVLPLDDGPLLIGSHCLRANKGGGLLGRKAWSQIRLLFVSYEPGNANPLKTSKWHIARRLHQEPIELKATSAGPH